MKVAQFPPDGCPVCRGWYAVSPRDARGAGCRVVWKRILGSLHSTWTAFCGSCGRLTGKGEGRPEGGGWGWNTQRSRVATRR